MKHLFLSIWFVCLSVASYSQINASFPYPVTASGDGEIIDPYPNRGVTTSAVLSDGEFFQCNIGLKYSTQQIFLRQWTEVDDFLIPFGIEHLYYDSLEVLEGQYIESFILDGGVSDTYFDTNPSTLEFYTIRLFENFAEDLYRIALQVISIDKSTFEEVDRYVFAPQIGFLETVDPYFFVNKKCGTIPYVQIGSQTILFGGEVPCECNCDEVNMVGEHHRPTIDIYPSPASNFINIEGVDSFVAHKVQIFDVNGHLVKETLFDSRMDVQNLSSGMYTLRILDHDSKVISAGQFVKQ